LLERFDFEEVELFCNCAVLNLLLGDIERRLPGALGCMLIGYFKSPVGNRNVWKKKNLWTRRKVRRPLLGSVNSQRLRKENFWKILSPWQVGYLTVSAVWMEYSRKPFMIGVGLSDFFLLGSQGP
jgi:hypothetical protein